LEGARRVAERLHEGRRRWIAQMRAEGRPLPFAGFRPKGSGKTREVREAEAQAKRSGRFHYDEAKRQAGDALWKAKMVRAMLPRYVRQDHLKFLEAPFDIPVKTIALPPFLEEGPLHINVPFHPLQACQELQALPEEGPFAGELARAKSKASAAVLPILKASMARTFKEEIKRYQREAAERQFEATRALMARIAEERSARAQPASGGLGACAPLPGSDPVSDIPPAPRKPPPAPKPAPVLQPDFAAQCQTNVRHRKHRTPSGLNEDDGRHYAFTASGERFLTSRRPR
jgi:hypothetical protein